RLGDRAAWLLWRSYTRLGNLSREDFAHVRDALGGDIAPHQASFRCSGDNRVHADAVRSVINGHASHEGGNRALACTVRTARTSRKGDEPRWRRCAHDGTWHACVAHFPDSVLAREKGSGQIGVQNPSPRRGGKFVYEASQINAGTREQAIGSADFVGDNLKGFLDLLFRANIAREAQGALSALF